MKNIIIILTMIFAVNVAHTQIEIELATGVNSSNSAILNSTQIGSVSNRIGYFVGFGPRIRLSDNFNILVNLQYSQKGYVEQHTEFRYQYADLINELEFSGLKSWRFGIGFNVAYNMLEELRYQDGPWASIGGLGTGIAYKKGDFGLTGRISFHVNQFQVFARYNHGLLDTNSIEYRDVGGEPLEVKQYNRNLQIGVAYNFKIK